MLDALTKSSNSNTALSQRAKNNAKITLYFLAVSTAKIEACARSESGVASTSAVGAMSEPTISKRGGKKVSSKKDKDQGDDDMDDQDENNDDEDFVAAAPKPAASSKAGAKAGAKGGAAKGGGKASKAAAAGGFGWVDFRSVCMDLIRKSARLEPSLLWSMGLVHENFLSAQWSLALELLETRPQGLSGAASTEAAARGVCVDVVSACVATFGSAGSTGSFSSLSTALIDALMRAEHMHTFAAEVCSRAPPALAYEVLGEMSRMPLDTLASAGVKNLGQFAESLAKANPELMTSQLPVVTTHLDSKVHQIRSSILHVLGTVVTFLHARATASPFLLGGDDANAAAAQQQQHADPAMRPLPQLSLVTNNPQKLTRIRDDLLDILVERAHDTSPYPRSACLKVGLFVCI